jgi:hypothetical protein
VQSVPRCAPDSGIAQVFLTSGSGFLSPHAATLLPRVNN